MQDTNGFDPRRDDAPISTTTDSCPECGGRVQSETIEWVCTNCGLIVDEDPLDHDRVWANTPASGGRTGPPRTPTRHDRGLSTCLGRHVDGRGNELSATQRQRAYRLRREQSRTICRETVERTERYGLGEVRRMASALGFGSGLRNQACRLFSTAQNAGLLPGRSIESVASGCVYAACRVNGRPITFDAVESVSRVSTAKVRYGYSVQNRELELPAEPMSAVAYLPQITSDLDVSQRVEQRSRELLCGEVTPEARGANPAGVAGGAVLLAADEWDESVTQAAVAEAAGVCIPTIRTYRDSLQ